MKKTLIIATSLAAVLLSSCVKDSQEYKDLQAVNDSLEAVNASKDKEMANYLQALNEISDNFQAIAASESLINADAADENIKYDAAQRINKNLKLMAGPILDLNGGFIYNLRNSNNPVQAKAYINLGASGMAIYRFKIKEYPFILRYQLNIPLVGILFSPEYGQPYYEMSLSHDWGKNICFTSIHNQPSLRQFLTLDFPIRSTVVRVGYIADIQQAKVNQLKSHQWSHAFMVGLVKNFYVFKGKRQVSMPSSISPF